MFEFDRDLAVVHVHRDGINAPVNQVSDTAARERRKILKDQLAKTHFISGSAVVPNLDNDDKWRKETEEITVEFKAKLNQAKSKLLAG